MQWKSFKDSISKDVYDLDCLEFTFVLLWRFHALSFVRLTKLTFVKLIYSPVYTAQTNPGSTQVETNPG